MKRYLAVFIMAAIGASAVGAVFHVDPVHGDAGGDGSAERPWRTVQEVFEKGLIRTADRNGRIRNADGPITGGDTILLYSGYHGEINARGYHNDQTITIAAAEGHTPQLRRIFFSDSSKWAIRGLTVSPSFAPEYKADRMIYVVDWGGASRDFVVEDNTLFSSPDAPGWSKQQWNDMACYGISFICDNAVIRRNTLRYVNFGIIVAGQKIAIEGNSIEHIAGDGIVCSADDSRLVGNSMKYFYNVNDNHDDGIQFHRGVDKTTPIRNVLVRGNRVVAWDDKVSNPLLHSPQGICNFDSPGPGWRVENNLVLVQHHHGITLSGLTDAVVVNNIAYNPYGGDFLAGIVLGTTHGKFSCENCIVRNNIVDSPVSCPGSNICDHNIIVKEPYRFFLDFDKLDVRHRPDSPAIDAASADSAPQTDIDGLRRPQGPAVDIGPYEYERKLNDESR